MLVICYSISQTSLSLTVSWKVKKKRMIILPNRYILQGRTQRSSVSFSRTFGAHGVCSSDSRGLLELSFPEWIGRWEIVQENPIFSVFKSMISCFPLPIDWFLDFPPLEFQLSLWQLSNPPCRLVRSFLLVKSSSSPKESFWEYPPVNVYIIMENHHAING